MQKLVANLVLSALVLAGSVCAASAQSASAPNGVWVGYYGYGDRADTVQMQMKFAGRGSTFTGLSIEPNTFGDDGVLFLTANIQGVTDSDGADFYKRHGRAEPQRRIYRRVHTRRKLPGGQMAHRHDRRPVQICADGRLVS
jgi:hypothetical protein